MAGEPLTEAEKTVN